MKYEPPNRPQRSPTRCVGSFGRGGQKMPRTSKMCGTWGYDAECSCGWKSRTGGATRRYVEGQVWLHKEGLI